MSFELQILNDVLDWARAPGGPAGDYIHPSHVSLWSYPREKAFQVHEGNNNPSSARYGFDSPYGGLVTLESLYKERVDSSGKNYKIESGTSVENFTRKRKFEASAEDDFFHLQKDIGVRERSFKKPRGYACKNCCMYSHI
ncbi:KLTH0B05192p [Lachancea thermotolerans CBS 6340]|uniref:KLTH0B05192p n=1 Tax=Lachancea thermotolerans (strain ATCC 56472 / CBS 6340 / NRRL Y-8284) TaxID=559295 RepID=C5DCR4_LACTC|nr:KLTH0B05192p [Lachancea thermotolerans CBS 6340]CAR21575.1 KLTH0B05192p [Lachancea thermotolerans CBS 6340]